MRNTLWLLIRALPPACVLFIATGCASTRYISDPTPAPGDLQLEAATEDLEVKLHHVIVPDGPGSWVKGAKWNEWVVSLRNRSGSDVSVERISLIDQTGLYVDSRYPSIEKLESESERMARTTQNIAGLAGSGPLIGEGVAQVAIATGSVIPVYLATPVIMGLWNAAPYLEAKDREAIQAEYQKRALPDSIKLGGSGAIRGSAFFPLMPPPVALVVTYRTTRGEGQVKIPLEKVSAISNVSQSQAPPREASISASSTGETEY